MPERPNPPRDPDASLAAEAKTELPADPDAAPTDQERVAAEALRAALDGAAPIAGDAELARALGATWSPAELPPDAHARILDGALARFDRRTRRKRAFTRAVGVGAALALAAGAVVVVEMRLPAPLPTSSSLAAVGEAPGVLAASRSTQPLFAEQFAVAGGETSRVDRIAAAREADYRRNRFARWGVR